MFKRKLNQISSTASKRNIYAALGVVLITGIVGYALTMTLAAGQTASIEAEQNVAGGATVADDVTASGGKALQYAAATDGGEPGGIGRPLKIMPLGDSITDGYSTPGSYRPTLWQLLVEQDGLEIDFVGSLQNGPGSLPDKDHEGHSGWKIDQLEGNIAGWLNTYEPDVILLHIGTNDLIQGASGSQAAQRLDTLVSTIFASKPDVTLLAASLIPLRTDGDWNQAPWQQFNDAVPGIVDKYKGQGYKVQFVDMAAEAGLTLGSPDIPDGVHPGAGGYSKMAEVWYPAIKTVYETF